MQDNNFNQTHFNEDKNSQNTSHVRFGENTHKNFYNRYPQKTIWAWFFGVVSTIAVAVSVFYGLKYKQTTKAQLNSEDYYKAQSMDTCRRSIYNLLDGLQNTDANIAKVLASKDKDFIVKTLTETNVVANSCVADLSYLPMSMDVSSSASRYFNQLGDYSKALCKSVLDKGNLTNEQKDSLKDLRKVGTKLTNSLSKATSSDDYFVWGTTDDNYTFQLQLEDLDENTFDYPQLVYDGPFSDSVTKKTFDKEILPVEKIEKILLQKFKNYAISDVNFVSKAQGKTTVYYFSIKLKGEQYYLATATDGTVAELTKNGSVEQQANAIAKDQDDQQQKMMEQKCTQVAMDMANALGYDVLPMWISKPIDGRIYVNMISRQDDVNLYPDMVKMVVDEKTCQVVGVDAYGYVANHKKRDIPINVISQTQAHARLLDDLKVEHTELCIVPQDNEEVLCYEIKVSNGDEKFLVYIDAITTQEVDILKIIEDEMGYTVM